ncbi:Ddl-like protein [Planctomycetes bacterium Pla163]|uniref:Ddl-like protein n=1 Tax=Rohdeia mirabilis TaxID=2528008 RepID=A0A518CWE3_9BACT|nr:Ddl-like protein [Planctomycetes bacterium Pla163]
MRRRRILLLVHEGLEPPASIEGLSSQEMAPFKAEYDVRVTLEELGHDVRVLGLGDELGPLRDAITEFEPHVAFNMLVHFRGLANMDAHVISYLELRRLAYTGVNPRGLVLANDKALSKKILAYHRIRVPGFAVFRKGRRAKRPAKLGFPLIVKGATEHASLGIAQASIVYSDEELAQRVDLIQRTVCPEAIAEEYIEGRELTVSVMGNERLETGPVWELSFDNLPAGSEPIATRKVKWDHAYQERIGLRSGPAAELESDVAARLEKLAKRIYKILGLSGYARVDLRMRPDGVPFVLEANPNPDLSFGEDFAESMEKRGYSYPQLVEKLVSLGERHAANGPG